MDKITRLGLTVLLLVGLSLAGCVSQASQNRPALRVGIVNLERILPELPEYKKYSADYEEERHQLFKGMKAADPGTPEFKKYFTSEKQQEIEKSVQKWDDKKRQFLEKTLSKVKAAAEAVAHDKGIDIVLVSAPWLPVSQRMAVDITTDVVYLLREQGNTVH